MSLRNSILSKIYKNQQTIKPLTKFNLLFSSLSRVRRLQLIALLFLTIFAALAEVVSFGSIIPFLNVMINGVDVDNPIFRFFTDIFGSAVFLEGYFTILILILVVLAAIAAGIIRMALIYWQTKISFGIGIDLSYEMYKTMLTRPFDLHRQSNKNQMAASVVKKTDHIVDSVIMPIVYIGSSGLLGVLIISGLVLLAPIVTLTSFLAIGGFYVITSIICQRGVNSSSQIVNLEMGNMLQTVQEGLGSFREILFSRGQDYHSSVFKTNITNLRNAQAKLVLIGTLPRYLLEAFAISAVAFFVAYVTSFSSTNSFTDMLPILAALAMGFHKLLPVIHMVYHATTQIRGASDTLDDILRYMGSETFDRADINVLPFRKAIILRDASYDYGDKRKAVIREMNLRIPKGEKLVILGPSGCGKSTLADLLSGLIYPNKGIVEIDNTPLSIDNCVSWWDNISYVPQNVFLSDTSILKNIILGSDINNIDEKALEDAVKISLLDEILEGLPFGLETVVGDSGSALSGGQRQRVGLARALYKRAEVMILDEATNALDLKTEQKILKGIVNRKPSLTLVVITHRSEVLEIFDRVLNLEDQLNVSERVF